AGSRPGAPSSADRSTLAHRRLLDAPSHPVFLSTRGESQMVNKVGSGRASGPDAQRASSEASRGALDGLRGAAPSFGFVFASPSLSLSETRTRSRRSRS